MAIYLRTSFVQRLQRRPGEFELASRFKRYGGATGRVFEAYDVAFLHNRLPAEMVAKALQHGAYAHRPLIAQRRKVIHVETELLVLGADTPGASVGFHARFEPGNKLVTAFDRGFGGKIITHR